MIQKTLDDKILERAQAWLEAPYDNDTQERVQAMIAQDPEMLKECFYTDLEFGTGGLRGKMGDGTNRVNKYTIGMATQGLANYVKNQFDGDISTAIAYDSRNNSPEFAQITAGVLAANGIKVYLFSALRPTPELSYAVRYKNCQGGIVITASHNPPEYNGYKVYWNDGGQVVAPHDKGIIAEVRATSVSDVKFEGNEHLIEMVDEEIDNAYLDEFGDYKLSPLDVEAQSDLKIVYTALHGTGITLIPEALKRHGFTNVQLVPEQDVPNGDFPTVESPNPEESQALQRGIALCKELEADILLGTDPDTDRVGLAVRNSSGDYELLNGNQAGSLLVYYHLLKWKESGKFTGNEFVAKTIVTTDLIARLAEGFGVKYYNTLTGFKWIAAQIREVEGKEQFITGGEESYGYMVGDKVRDKDAVLSSVMFCEIAAWAKNKGRSMMDILHQMYAEFGCFQESLVSLKKEGISGKEEIAAMMTTLRMSPPSELAGSEVLELMDCEHQTITNLQTGSQRSTGLPKSNVIQFLTEDGSRVTARPSGTEPKIKFYFSVNEAVKGQNIDDVTARLQDKIAALKRDLNI